MVAEYVHLGFHGRRVQNRAGHQTVSLETDHKEDTAMAYTRSEVPELESMMRSGKKKFVRYEEGAKLYSMGLHLDNDEAGINAAKAIQIVLKDRRVEIQPPPKGFKDVNEYLVSMVGNYRKNTMEL